MSRPRPTGTPSHPPRWRALALVSLVSAIVVSGLAIQPGVAVTSEVAAATPEATTGVWHIWGSKEEAASMPYVVGGQVSIDWARIEPARGVFDWTELDRELAAFDAAGKPATVQVNSNLKPPWIYENGVAFCGNYYRRADVNEIPQYWDPDYMVMMREMLDALAAKLRSSPYRDLVLGVRAAPNLIGTEPHLLTDPEAAPNLFCLLDWNVQKANAAYEQSMRMNYEAFMPDIRPILRSNLFLTVNPDPALRTELLGRDKAWVFGTNADPDNPLPNVDQFYEEWVKSGRTLGYYESRVPPLAHQRSWAYWRQLMDLGRGVSYVATYASDLRGANTGMPGSEEFRAAFDFTNKYAGFGDKPALTPGGWVAFGGGPDGTGENYGMFMTQLNANGTPGAASTMVALDSDEGTNIIGPTDQRFGRFARRTDRANGKSKVFLRVAPEYKSTLVNGSQVAVTYLDQGAGSVNVQWGTAAGQQRTILKSGSGLWQRVVVDVPAGGMNGGLEATADLVLSVTGSDTTFHMVEVERQAGPVPTVSLTAPSVAKGTVTLKATASPPAGRTLASVTFLVDNAVIAVDKVAAYKTAWDSTTVADGPHNVVALATDSAGAVATSAATVTVVNHDIVPPTAVSNLVGFAPGPTQIELQWSPATDDVGIAGYQIVRNGVNLGTFPGTSFSDTTVAPSTTYTYTVRAVDLAGNKGVTKKVIVMTPAVGAGIRLVGSTSANLYESAATLAVPPTEPGQVLIASFSARGLNLVVIPPAGWDLVRRTDNVGAVNQAIYSRVAGPSEPTSATWSMVGRRSVTAVVQAFSGVDTTTPVEASSGAAALTPAMTAPGITTLGPNRLVLGVYSVGAATTIEPPAGMTEEAEVQHANATDPLLTLEVSSMPAFIAGATGDRTATAAQANKSYVAQLVALRPKP